MQVKVKSNFKIQPSKHKAHNNLVSLLLCGKTNNNHQDTKYTKQLTTMCTVYPYGKTIELKNRTTKTRSTQSN
ncbi:hypothetical protein AQF98_03800 [Pedobacter sp. Hv1]|nr:hypothetical protein AQF98_03800 [Pedobacter sp. Hv1]